MGPNAKKTCFVSYTFQPKHHRVALGCFTTFHFPPFFVTIGTYKEEMDAQMPQSRFSEGAPQLVLVELTDEALTKTSDGHLSLYHRQLFQISYYTTSPIVKRQFQMAAIPGNPFHDLGMTIQGTPFGSTSINR